MKYYGFVSSGSGWGTVAGSYEESNEHSGCAIFGKFLEQLSKC
jgi:hypothetical protein